MLSKNIVDIKNMNSNIIKSLYLDEVIWEKQGGIKWYGVDELLAMGAEEYIDLSAIDLKTPNRDYIRSPICYLTYFVILDKPISSKDNNSILIMYDKGYTENYMQESTTDKFQIMTAPALRPSSTDRVRCLPFAKREYNHVTQNKTGVGVSPLSLYFSYKPNVLDFNVADDYIDYGERNPPAPYGKIFVPTGGAFQLKTSKEEFDGKVQNRTIKGPMNIKNHLKDGTSFYGFRIPTYINESDIMESFGGEVPRYPLKNSRAYSETTNDIRERFSTEKNLNRFREELRKMDIRIAFINSDVDNVRPENY